MRSLRSALMGLALALAVAAPAEARALKMLWGPNELPDGSAAFPLYRELGVDVLHAQLQWRVTAPRRPRRPRDPADPAYEWPARIDTMVRESAAAGIGAALMVKTTPDWANSGRGQARAPNRDVDYADFLVAAARRYPTVRHWMVWGEPQRGDSFEPMPVGRRSGPRRYARLLDRAYAALKRLSPVNRVIGGNTWTAGAIGPRDFLRWMRLPNGRPPRLDYFGHNPYSARYPRLKSAPYDAGIRDICDLDTLASQLRRTYGRRKRLWLSEYNVPSEPNAVFNFSVTPGEQADWLSAAYRLADGYGPVVGLGWFQLLDTADLPAGLLRADGSAKPALNAFRNAG